MKQVFAYSLLFCLVFLNVPRTLVHDCHHQEQEDHSGISADTHIENESCFICDFDLGFYTIESPIFFNYTKQTPMRITEAVVDRCSIDPICHSLLRGPPAV